MMPDMQPWRIEYEPENSPIKVQVGMIEVANDGSEDGNPQDHLRIHAEYHEGKISQAVVDGNLHPVKSHVSDPIQLPDTMVEFMKLPQARNAVEQIMYAPLKEVLCDQEHDELHPEGRMRKQRDGFMTGRGSPAEDLTGRLQRPTGQI